MNKRCLLASLMTLAAVALPMTTLLAQDNRPFHIIVGMPAGGTQDIYARHIADSLTPKLGVPVIVENKPGASGMIAADQVAKMPAGSNSIMITTGGAITIAPHLYPKLPYNPEKEFLSVAMFADIPMALAVRTDSPYKTAGDVIAAARAKPEQLTVGNSGNGSISHLTAALLSQATNTKLLNVPYKGGAGVIQDLLGGQIEAIVTSAVALESFVETGKIRVLGTFTKTRLQNTGGAPTVSEALGVKGLEFPVWVGLVAPASMPRPLVTKLSQEIVAICNAPATREKFKDAISCGDATFLDRVMQEDRERWEKTIRNAGIKGD